MKGLFSGPSVPLVFDLSPTHTLVPRVERIRRFFLDRRLLCADRGRLSIGSSSKSAHSRYISTGWHRIP